jgi:hypothetical protein
MATLFRDSSVVNWIAASNIHNGAVFINKVLYVIFGSRQEIFATTMALANLAKFSRMRTKAGLQYPILINTEYALNKMC